MEQVKFVKRIGTSDLLTNKYFNDVIYCGKNTGYAKCGRSYQCVYGVTHRAQELAERPCVYWKGTSEKKDIELPMFNRYGIPNAKEFFDLTLWDKTTNPNEARLGDIIVYGSNWGGGYGHVRTIEEIHDDYFICSAANENYDGKYVCNIKASKTGMIGFIHNPFLKFDEEEKETIDYESKYNTLKKRIKEVYDEC